jgi:hypothetical protein
LVMNTPSEDWSAARESTSEIMTTGQGHDSTFVPAVSAGDLRCRG